MKPSDIVIVTVHDGAKDCDTITWGYMHTREQLLYMGMLGSINTIHVQDDLPRSRSRAIAHALRVPGWRYMLWWDDDVIPHDPGILLRMHALAHQADLDVLGAPYPRKRIPIDIPYRPLRENMARGLALDFSEDGRAEVEGVGIGFCLMSRRCLEAMTEHYREALWCTDDADPEHREMVCLTDPMFTAEEQRGGRRFREKLSEDYSIQARWRAMGGKVYLYAEHGMKLGHAGRYTFTGTLDDLGNAR